MAKYLDYNGLQYFWQSFRGLFVSDITYDTTTRKFQKKKKTGTNGAEQVTDIVTLATVATSGSYSDLSNKPTIPSAGTGTNYPKMDGTQALGSEAGYARVDHVHPTDTSRAAANHSHDAATTSAAGFMSSADKTKLNGIATGAEVNQNAFSTITILNGGAVVANAKTDSVEFIAGNNMSIEADDDAITFSATDHDTKNTAGSTDISNKIFLIGATSQAANPQTYSHDTAYVGADGHLYSNGIQAVNLSASQALTNKTYNGYTLGAACAKGISTSMPASVTDDTVLTTKGVKLAIDNALSGAATYQGEMTPTIYNALTEYKSGWYWVVTTAGTIAGETCEVGDMIFAHADLERGQSPNPADFDIVQNNIDTITNAEITTILAS